MKLLCSDYHLMEACLWGFYGRDKDDVEIGCLLEYVRGCGCGIGGDDEDGDVEGMVSEEAFA